MLRDRSWLPENPVWLRPVPFARIVARWTNRTCFAFLRRLELERAQTGRAKRPGTRRRERSADSESHERRVSIAIAGQGKCT